MQLSIWPGGASSNAPGTIQWAGGPIDWNSPDIKNNGYYYATLGEVSMQCYNASSPPGTNNDVSYTYKSAVATNDTVVNGKDNTVLKSFLDTGLDMDANAPTGTASPTAAQIPGGNNGNPGQNPNGNGGSGGTGTGSGSDCSTTGFAQSCNSNNKNDGSRAQDRVLGASAFAVVVAVAALLWI